MKRISLYVIGLLFLLASFLAGYWYKARDSGTASPGEARIASRSTTGESPEEVPGSDIASGTVRISPERQQMIGIQVGTAKKVSETHTLRLVGRVAADETRVYRINAAVDGWIRGTFTNSTGSLVKKDEPLQGTGPPTKRPCQEKKASPTEIGPSSQ